MSDGKLETLEPDPAATGISNDQPVNKSGSPEEKDEKPDAPLAAEAAAQPDKPVETLTEEKLAKDTAVETTGLPVEESKEGDQKSGSPQKRRREDDDRRGGRGNFKRAKRGTVFDPTSQKETDDPVAIRKQVEFYFSDANLARDKFLFGKLEGSKNIPIEIKTIHSFKRMRRYQPYEAVVNALKESTVLEVTEDEKIKRKQPLPTDFEDKTLDEITKAHDDESMARSVYVKGFGFEKPTTQFDIEAWFANFGNTNQVRLRRLNDKTFKGSAFVEFESEDVAKKFLALDPQPKYNDRELKIMTKKAYLEEKAQLVKDGVLKPNANGGYDKVGDSRDKRGNDDERDWRERREEDRKSGFKHNSRGKRGFRGGRGRGGRDHGGRDKQRSDADDKENDEGRDDESNQNGSDAKKQVEAVAESNGDKAAPEKASEQKADDAIET